MKVIMAKQDLEREALAQMRSHPGCEALTVVEVQFTDLRTDTNWALLAFTEAAADPEAIQRALIETQEKLRHQYELRVPE